MNSITMAARKDEQTQEYQQQKNRHEKGKIRIPS